ncbi:MAG: hypothetical protein MUE46_12995 [Xanthomonadales bacterium]|jgi:hypothetical protein|nr:hypothetical protein [Xanthomonadales bacterium]
MSALRAWILVSLACSGSLGVIASPSGPVGPVQRDAGAGTVRVWQAPDLLGPSTTVAIPLRPDAPLSESLHGVPTVPSDRIVGIPVPVEMRQVQPIYDLSRMPAGVTQPDPPSPYRQGAAPYPKGVGAPPADKLGPSDGVERSEPPAQARPDPQSLRNPPSLSFDSLSFDDNQSLAGALFIPPDTHAAAGPNHVVNVTNVSLRVHDKTSGAAVFSSSLRNFFTSPGFTAPVNATFDPKVLYDEYAGRWLVVTLEKTASDSALFLAASATSDPTGSWFLARIPAAQTINGSNCWFDYPGFAVGTDAVYLTGNYFRQSDNQSCGSRLVIVSKSFYNGGTASAAIVDPYVGAVATTHQPAQMYGTPPQGASTFLVGFSGITLGGTQSAAQIIRVSNPLGTPVFASQIVDYGQLLVNVTATAPQSGSGTGIAVNDRRALSAVWRNNNLYFTHSSRPPATAADAAENAAWWVRVDTSNLAALTRADIGYIGGDQITPNAHTSFPAVAVNAVGDMAVGFSVTGSGIFPSSAYTWRAASDAPGSTRTPQVLRAGTDFYIRTFSGTANRWGDYSGAAVDPSDGCFWISNQHAITRGTISNGTQDGRWMVATGRFCGSASSSGTLSVTGPTLLPGASGSATVQLGGTPISGAQFRLCVDGSRLSLGSATIPSGLAGLSCAAQTAGNCPAGTTVGINCTGFAPLSDWTLPQSFTVALSAAAGAPAGATPLAFANGAIFVDPDGNEFSPTLGSGSASISATYTVGGTLSGLAAGRSVVLRNAVSGENLTRSANGSYTFATAQPTGASYNVSVQTQPIGQICSVANGVGLIGSSNVTSVNVNCVDNAYTMVASSPSIARGASGNASVQLGGPDVAGATFRICVDGSRLTPGAASVPAGLPGLSCTLTSTGCPAGTTTGWFCNGFAPSGTWTLPQTITLPLSAAAAATLGSTPLAFAAGPVMADGNGNNLSVAASNGTLTITGTLSVGGTLSGLAAGQTVVLRNTITAENLSRTANGGFTFATAQANGASYNVIVQTQPAGQSCSVTGGSGTLAGNDVSNIAVNCAASGHTLSVSAPSAAPGGSSTASVVLTGPGVAGAQFRLCVDGARLSLGTATVPPGLGGVACAAQTAGNCPAGTTVGISCAGFSAAGTWTLPQTISVPLTVAAGAPFGNTPLGFSGVIFADDNGNKLPVTISNGNFSVATTYTVGGTISGLGSGLSVVLRNTVTGENLSRNANGAYAFTTGQASGANYNVTVQTQPTGQLCTVANATGAIGTANVSSVNVSCTTTTYTVGGTLSGLAAGRSLVLRNAVTGENLTRTANGSYTFATAQATGASFNIAVQTQPTGQTCTVANATGTIGTANVTNVNVSCPAPAVFNATPAPGTTLDFGPVVFDESREVSVQIANAVAAGGMPLVLGGCTVSGNAALSRVDGLSFPQSVPPGASISIRVRLAASAALSNPVTGTLSCTQEISGPAALVQSCSEEGGCTAGSAHTLSITAPAVSPGGTSNASVVLSGPGVAGAQFRLCVDGARLSIGTPSVPPGLAGVACTAAVAGNCPAGTTVGISCAGFSAAGTWTFPQTINVPLTAVAGAPLGSTPLSLGGVTFADDNGNKLPVTINSGTLSISQTAASWPLTGRVVPQQIFGNGFEN